LNLDIGYSAYWGCRASTWKNTFRLQVESIALNSTTTAKNEAEEAAAAREYFSGMQFAYAQA